MILSSYNPFLHQQIIYAHLDNLAKWCDAWQLKFNPTKCKVIHFGQATHSYGGYYLNGTQLIVIKTWVNRSEVPPTCFRGSYES